MTFSRSSTKSRVKIQLAPRPDGVYIVIDNPSGQPVSRADVSAVLNGDIVQDVDFAALDTVFGSSKPHLEVKISESIMSSIEEDIKLEVSADKMKVIASFSKPAGGGRTLTANEIKDKLQELGVVSGVMDEVIEKLTITKNYNKSYVIAKGKAPNDDTDGRLVFSFDAEKSSYKPKLNEDGTADFRNIGMFKLAMKGQILVTVVDMVEGEDGYNVFGSPLPRRKGKKAPPLPRGKNVTPDANGKRLFADINGQILYVNNKVSVYPMLEINGNVDNKTGNVDFNGSISIKGDILTGFKVQASGHVDVVGVIEGAYVQTGGNLNCAGGILGMNKAEIIAAGSVTTKSINNCELQAGGDIITNQILHSKIEAGGKIEVNAGKGFIVGGKVFSTENISCKIVGSAMATATTIEIGASQAKIAEYNEIVSEMSKTKAEYKKICDAINQVMSAISMNKMSPEKKMLLAKFENMRDQVLAKLEDCKEQIDELMPQVNNNSGYLSVSDIIHPGVSVTIGNAVMIVRDDIHHSKLVNEKAKVVIAMY